VFAQVMMAVVLTAGAGFLGRSLARLVSINNGFTVDRLGAVDLSMRGAVGDLRPLFRDLTAAVESIPDVRGAAFAMQLPTQIAGLRTQVRLNGGSPSPVTATLRPVGARYFEVLDVPLSPGVFAETDVHAPHRRHRQPTFRARHPGERQRSAPNWPPPY
jgi:hypothetical protein